MRKSGARATAAFTQPVRWVSALSRAVADRDAEAMAALRAPDFVVHDHSPLGWGTLDGPAYTESVKAAVALAPDFRIRTEHLWLSGRGALGIHVVRGTYEGGAFEQPRITVSEIDAQGRERRRDIYTFDQLAEARARFEAIGASAARDPLAALARPNAATAAMDRVQAAFEARDWAAMRAVYATDAKVEDRRHLALASGDVEWWIADKQQVARVRPDARYEGQLVGTYGDRLALERLLWTGAPEGRFEVEYLWLTEVDERGRITAAISFDLDDWRAAAREARPRWLAADAAAAPVVGPVSEFF